MSPRMPAVFFGHGTPMNAIQNNRYTEAWRRLGLTLPRPRAILAISAHWYTNGTGVTAMERPPTIHDFGGFPRELFDMEYPAPGDPALARQVRDLLEPVNVVLDDKGWGFDHGTWSVLVHAYPKADIPVVQLSIDGTQEPQVHYDIGQRLTALREDGVLVAGFGNVVHNLGLMQRRPDAPVPDWSVRFNDWVREHLLKGEHWPLIHYETMGRDAQMAVPTPEHYLPLLYVIGTQTEDDEVDVVADGIDMGSVSMLSAALGT
jgi:4,5-DOPA dioxygenase extradiol